MKPSELNHIIARDEDSQHQFKANLNNEVSAAQEMIAFSNTLGGLLIIGIDNNGTVTGLKREDMGRLNALISNAASQQVRPPINPITENIALPDGLVMVVRVPKGIAKPYMDKNGVIWIKSGADKRKATSREEIQRMYQSAHLMHGDEMLIPAVTTKDIDQLQFSAFYEQQYDEPLSEQSLTLSQLFENLNLQKNNTLNLAGALLFTPHPHLKLPAFIVKCVAYPGNEIGLDKYYDSQDIGGSLKTLFDDTLAFIMRNLKRIQAGGDVNSLGTLEIPKIVLEELLTNALIHRDYFISAPIRVFIFKNKVEIISPGHLPNSLTIENIKNGNSNIRNPILASFATKLLPYRGLGSGIRRAVKSYPAIQFEDDREGNQFKVCILRGHLNINDT